MDNVESWKKKNVPVPSSTIQRQSHHHFGMFLSHFSRQDVHLFFKHWYIVIFNWTSEHAYTFSWRFFHRWIFYVQSHERFKIHNLIIWFSSCWRCLVKGTPFPFFVYWLLCPVKSDSLLKWGFFQEFHAELALMLVDGLLEQAHSISDQNFLLSNS